MAALNAFFQIDKRTRRRIGVLLLVGNALVVDDLPQPVGVLGVAAAQHAKKANRGSTRRGEAWI